MYIGLLIGGVLSLASSIPGMPDAPLIPLVVTVCAAGAAYLLSGRLFVELTSMHGTYRIAVQHGDSEIENAIARLRNRIFPKA